MNPYVTQFVCSNCLHFHYCKYCSDILVIFFFQRKLCLVPGPISDLLFSPPYCCCYATHGGPRAGENALTLYNMSQFLSQIITSKSQIPVDSVVPSLPLFLLMLFRGCYCAPSKQHWTD